MEKQDMLKTVIQVNRIIVGSLLLLFVLMTDTTPLGVIALLPLMAAVIVLCGVLSCPPIPVIITRIIDKVLYSSPKGRGKWRDISERHIGGAV
ncbi:MAG: hypothetical protein GXP08_15125 [Gammaproteobacteria bacterium]|nr:hypothetical protein [Gammaproteobacteria bacterium]